MGKIVQFPIQSDNPPAPVVVELVRRERSVPSVGDVLRREVALRRLSAVNANLFSCGLTVADTLNQVQRDASADAICDQRMHEALVGAARAALGILDTLGRGQDRDLRQSVQHWLEQNGESTDG